MTIDDVLEKAGIEMPRNRKIVCPFHEDGDPSLHLYDNGAYCFACHTSASPEWLLRALTGEYVQRTMSTENLARKVRGSAWQRFLKLSGQFFMRLDAITKGSGVAVAQKIMWGDAFQSVAQAISDQDCPPPYAEQAVEELAVAASHGLRVAHSLVEWEREAQ